MNEAYNIRAPKCTYKMSYQARKNGREHQIIAEIMIGRPLKPNEVVHHIDGNKRNNDANNLIVVTRSEHIRIHAKDICRKKPVLQISDDGTVIEKFCSAMEAERVTGVSNCNISACCHGRHLRAGGYAWRFADVEVGAYE